MTVIYFKIKLDSVSYVMLTLAKLKKYEKKKIAKVWTDPTSDIHDHAVN